MLLKILGVFIILGILYYIFPIAIVYGQSMQPTLYEKDIVIGFRLFSRKNLKPNHIYILNAPYSRKVIKRLKWFYQDKCYFLGDNPPYSHDSRHYGLVNSKDIICKVIFIIKRRREI